MSKKMLLLTAIATTLIWGLGLDEPISRFVYGLRHPFITRVMHAISFAGSVYTLVPLCIGILILLCRKSRWMALAIPLGTLVAWQGSEILKKVIMRPRPDISQLAHESSYSFPSGHAMSNTAFYLLILMWSPKNRFAQVFCISMIVLMSFSRVYLGVHWPSDVLGGITLAMVVVEVIFGLTKRRLKQPSRSRIDI